VTDLTTFSGFVAYNGAVPEGDVDTIKALITAYSQWVRSYTARDFSITSYARRFDGRNTDRLMLPQTPVVSVSSVAVGISVITAQPDFGQVGFWFDDDSVMLEGHRFERGVGNVAIEWEAGYATIPVDIAQAVNELVGLRYALRDKQGWASKSLAGETVSLITKDMPDSVKAVLNSYRRVVPA